MNQNVVNEFISSVSVNGNVSPVDIGIGLLMMSEFSDNANFNLSDFRMTGGSSGLLSRYMLINNSNI